MDKSVEHPYSNLEEKQFWRPSIGEKNPLDIDQLWTPKFEIDKKDKFSTYGSCFAQHFSKSLIARGYRWVHAERPPRGLSATNIENFGYSIYSSRTQNIYTPTMLCQWLEIAMNNRAAPSEFWEENGRYFDPLRPTIEPMGFESIEELQVSRRHLLNCFIASIRRSTIFVFTLGLTERWVNTDSGFEYSLCPGTSYGEFNESKHAFDNINFYAIYEAMTKSIEYLREINSDIKILLTVSPVPLVATYEKRHVLLSTMESKSNLRSVSGMLAKEFSFVDYFPSYEIISSFPFKGIFFEPNMRGVSKKGVEFVMSCFFTSIGDDSSTSSRQKKVLKKHQKKVSDSDIACEEELLEAFSK